MKEFVWIVEWCKMIKDWKRTLNGRFMTTFERKKDGFEIRITKEGGIWFVDTDSDRVYFSAPDKKVEFEYADNYMSKN